MGESESGSSSQHPGNQAGRHVSGCCEGAGGTSQPYGVERVGGERGEGAQASGGERIPKPAPGRMRVHKPVPDRAKHKRPAYIDGKDDVWDGAGRVRNGLDERIARESAHGSACSHSGGHAEVVAKPAATGRREHRWRGGSGDRSKRARWYGGRRVYVRFERVQRKSSYQRVSAMPRLAEKRTPSPARPVTSTREGLKTMGTRENGVTERPSARSWPVQLAMRCMPG